VGFITRVWRSLYYCKEHEQHGKSRENTAEYDSSGQMEYCLLRRDCSIRSILIPSTSDCKKKRSIKNQTDGHRGQSPSHLMSHLSSVKARLISSPNMRFERKCLPVSTSDSAPLEPSLTPAPLQTCSPPGCTTEARTQPSLPGAAGGENRAAGEGG
jgi:hypothetical protein